jgi:hypothetical protein
MTLGVKDENRKNIFNLPQVTNKMLNFMAFYYWHQGCKNDAIEFGKPICNPWGQ